MAVLDDVRKSLGAVATDATLEPAVRVRALRRMRDDLRQRMKGEPEGTEAHGIIRALVGQADTYIGDAELEREARALDDSLLRLTAAENADLDADLAAGVADGSTEEAPGGDTTHLPDVRGQSQD